MSKPQPTDQPPFLGSWRTIYLIVLGNLVLLILLFHFFSRAFS